MHWTHAASRAVLYIGALGPATGWAQGASPAPAQRAHPHHPAAQPQGASAASPPLTYRNVFAEVPAGVERGRVEWKRANDDVGQFQRGHIDLLKWEAEHLPPPAGRPAPQPHGGHR